MKRKKGLLAVLSAMLLLSACLGGCVDEEPVHHRRTTEEVQTETATETVLGVVTLVDTEYKNLGFYEVGSEEEVLYSYTGATWFYSKSGASIAAAQLSCGDVVDITFETETHKIVKVQLAADDDLMENSRVTNFAISATGKETGSFRLGSSALYSYDAHTYVYSDGERISMAELINSTDILHVWAYGSRVISVIVEGGHGYLSLSGDNLFLGGYITISGVLARTIEQNMLLTVPEGTYTVQVEHDSYYSEKEVTIVRGEESTLDFSDVPAVLQQMGNVRFYITPSTASLYIDSVEYAYDAIISLSAGSHNIAVIDDTYGTYSDTLEVDPEYQTVTIDLTGEAETEADQDVETDAEDATTATVVSTTNTLTIQGPTGALVFFDSSYKGLAPVTFALVTGEHDITIYYNNQINTYSVNLAEGGDDVVYDYTSSFTD